ncbi:MAG: hypothetical protein LBK63_01405 [Treponema sp.]|jgi:hypothetical protein|nr:hypothetical protein [Treponema sp.]
MKKLALIIGFGVGLSMSNVFAEDAKNLDAWSGRFEVLPSLSFYSHGWDEDGEKQDVDKTEVLNAGVVLDYGFADWISASFKWSPGWNVWAYVDGEADSGPEGFYGPALSGRFQIIGANAPVKTEHFRLALIPGVMLPFPMADADEKAGNNAFGFGGALSFDSDIGSMFFVNLFGEFYVCPIENKEDVKHGWNARFEAEPHFEIDLPRDVHLSAGLPAAFALAPEKEIKGSGDGQDSYLLSLSPNVAARFNGASVPIEFSVRYGLPLLGKNTLAAHSLTLGVAVYF